MVLVDTSIWVDHLRGGNASLIGMLNEGLVACHPFIIGEIACGHVKERTEVLGLLAELPQMPTAEHWELMSLVARHRLFGRGLGWIDIHLLGSALLSSTPLWTADRALNEAARALHIAADSRRLR